MERVRKDLQKQAPSWKRVVHPNTCNCSLDEHHEDPDGAMFEALPGARKWGLLCYMQGSCNKAQAEASEKRKAADEERMGGAPVLGANLVLITGAVSGEVEMEDGADKVYLIEKFLGKVTNSNVRKGWAKTHLGAEKVDIEASGCYFVKWQGYSKMSDIEICAKISDGDSVPNDIFARANIRIGTSTEKEEMKNLLPERGCKWRSLHQ